MIWKSKEKGDGIKKTTRLLAILTAIFLVTAFAKSSLADYAGAVKADKEPPTIFKLN